MRVTATSGQGKSESSDRFGVGTTRRIVQAIGAVVVAASAVWAALVVPPEIRRILNDVALDPVGAVDSRYRAADGSTGSFLSDRDCGWVTPVSGVDSQGRTVDRTIWVFCDSAAYTVDGDPWAMPFGFPTNTVGIADPAATGDGSSLLPVAVTPAVLGGDGQPASLSTLIQAGADTQPLACPESTTRHEWIRGIGTLPDNEPGHETVVLFYQNFCVDLSAQDYQAEVGGVALLRWSADQPDADLVGERLNDAWFRPGALRDERSRQAPPVYTYGTGPLIEPWATPAESSAPELAAYTYMCGAAGDCTVARAPLSSLVSGRENALVLADTANWTYWSEQGWHAFPAAGVDGTCAPTEFDPCDRRPAPQVVSDAGRFNGYSQPGAEPSVKRVGDRYYLLYAPGFPGRVFVYREATSPTGPFDTYHYVTVPDEAGCNAGCRVPIWHPELDQDGQWAISYYDMGGLNGAVSGDRDFGEIRIGRFTPD